MRAVEELGYRPNLLARALQTRRTDLIGILVSDFSNPAYLAILDLFTQAAQRRGLNTLIFNVRHGSELTEAVQMVTRYQVDGLIVTSATLSPTLARECARQQLPVVIFGRYSMHAPSNAICSDNVAGGALAGELVVERGYRRPAFIGGPMGVSTTTDRARGFVQGLTRRGLALWHAESGGDYSYDAGFRAACRLLDKPERPDVVFCSSDIIAFGAMDAARFRFGMNVPQDIGFIGYDDIPLAAALAYQLTTIRQPFARMATLSMDLLIDSIDNPQRKPTLRFLGVELVERGSIRAPQLNPV
jgi:LacI family transcriptional regulator